MPTEAAEAKREGGRGNVPVWLLDEEKQAILAPAVESKSTLRFIDCVNVAKNINSGIDAVEIEQLR